MTRAETLRFIWAVIAVAAAGTSLSFFTDALSVHDWFYVALRLFSAAFFLMGAAVAYIALARVFRAWRRQG